MRSFERENIRAMVGYTPGEQPEATDIIKLNTNENPYPASQAVADALHTLDVASLRRYPSPTAMEFRKIAAGLHGVRPENIIATNGGDELLRLLFTTFVEIGESVGVAEPSYSLYPVLAAIHGCSVRRIDLTSEWDLPDDFVDRLNHGAGVKLAFVVNPHAPSGRLFQSEVLADIARKLNGILVIDEAYVDFIDTDQGYDAVRLVEECDNIIILRTLSKGYSLAGLRFGYGIGSANLVAPMLDKTKDSYNVDVVSQHLATAALKDRKSAELTWQAVRKERLRMVTEFEKLGFVVLPSQANFLLVGVPQNYAGGAESLYNALKSAGILVRFFDEERLCDKLRITIGTPQENDRLLQVLMAAIYR